MRQATPNIKCLENVENKNIKIEKNDRKKYYCKNILIYL